MRRVVLSVLALAVPVTAARADTPGQPPVSPLAPVLHWSDREAASILESTCSTYADGALRCVISSLARGVRVPTVTRRRIAVTLASPADDLGLRFSPAGSGIEQTVAVVRTSTTAWTALLPRRAGTLRFTVSYEGGAMSVTTLARSRPRLFRPARSIADGT